MTANSLVLAMAAHVAWTSTLYALLTVARAPSVWGLFQNDDGTNPWSRYESRVSANLRNQFEWPLFFYVICLLELQQTLPPDSIQSVLAWVFVAGRLLHTAVQILSDNVRLRGMVFTVNFVAVLAMWARFLHT
ncbi:MAG: MAPEG family protein [Pseudomonadota bacterium]